MNKTSNLVVFVFIIIGISVFVNTLFFSNSQPHQKISIAVSKTPLSAPFYIAQNLNYFEDNHLDVNIIEVIGGKNSFKYVMEDKADYGTSSDSVIMFGGLNGDEFLNITSFVESDNDIKLILNTNDSVSVTDLKNKKVGVIKGSSSEYFLSLILQLNQLSINDVELVALSPSAMQSEIHLNNVSAVAVWEPYAYKIKKELGEKVIILNTKNLYTLSFNLITKNNDGSNKNETNKKLLKALKQAIIFINTNPKKAKKILIDRLKLDQDFIDWVLPDYIYSLSLNSSLLLNIEDQARWAIQSGVTQLKTIPNYKKLMDAEALIVIDERAVSFRN